MSNIKREVQLSFEGLPEACPVCARRRRKQRAASRRYREKEKSNVRKR